jgi:IBR domain, a half RING-finger domain
MNAIQLCIQYQSISEEKKARVDVKHPWLKSYLSWKASDESSVRDWVYVHASFCPRCDEAIEKVEGCFHITCPCGCHFCYNCKKEYDASVIYSHECFFDEQAIFDNFALFD